MDEAVAGSIAGASERSTDQIEAAPHHRMAGYCAGCGTWDEHGPTCMSCGYDFTGADGSAEA